jgi:3-hydroxybutyryl-CoA dehydrogenase
MLTVAVIGAGAQGREFALACATAGFQVILEDVMPEKLRNATQAFSELGLHVRVVTSVEDAVREADIAVDFVPDELESKLEIWSLIDRMAPPRTILCTPSDVLSITDLASCTYRDDRCVMSRGMMGLASHEPGNHVHLLSAAATSTNTLHTARQLFTTLGYTVKIQPDPDLPQLMKNMRLAEGF